MKTKKRAFLSLKIAIITVVLLPFVTRADGELSVSLEGQTGSTNRSKYGYTVGQPQCYPCEEVAPKLYKTVTVEQTHEQWGDEPLTIIESGSLNYTLTFTNETTEIYVSASGGDGCAGCSDTVTNHVTHYAYIQSDGSPGQCSCHFLNGWIHADQSIECLGETSFKETRTMTPAYGIGTAVTTWAFSDEYTTAELLNASDLEYNGPEWNDTSGAYSQITWDEWAAILQKGKYRFKVVAAAGKAFRIHFTEHYATQNGDYTNSPGEVRGVGTGQTQYIEGPSYAPESTYKMVDGCTNIIGVARWVTLGCSSYDNDDGTDGCGGGSASLGCSTCSDGAGSTHTCPFPMRTSVSLGAGAFGEENNQLIVAEPSPSTNLFAPSGLEYFGGREGVEIIRANGSLRQVVTPLMLADIKTNHATSYSIRLYTGYGSESGGLYDVTGYTPFSTTTFAQGTSTNQLIVTVANGATTEYVYDWSAADQGWTLTSGDGARKQSVTWNDTALARTNIIRNAANQVISKTVEYFAEFGSLGQQKIKKVVDPDGAALTSQWFYYDNSGTDGTNYGEIKLKIEPNGFWMRYEYDTNNRVSKEISQFLNAVTNAAENVCRVVEYDYNAPTNTFSWVRRIEKLLGQEIGRQYTLHYGWKTVSIQCQTPGAAWDAADNLVTTTELYTSGDFIGDTRSVLHPNGTMQLYEYDANSTAKTTTVFSGQPGPYVTNIVDGTESIAVTDITGAETYRLVYDVASDIQIANDYHTYDELGRLTATTHLDGTSTSATYACCGMETSTDRDGTVTSYSYDALKRQTASTRNGITATNILDAASRLLATIRIGSDTSSITNSRMAYDIAGRLTRATNALGGVTIYTNVFDGSGQTIKTNTAPDGGTRIEVYYQDGSLQKVLGSAAFPVRYVYDVEQDGGVYRAYTKEIKLNASGADTAEWTKTYTDMLGRSYKTVHAAASGNPVNLSFYNNKGQLANQVDPDGVMALYQYNGNGEIEYTAVDLNTNGVIDFSGTDRITRTVTLVTNDGGYDVRRTLTYAWSTDSQNTSRLLNTRDMAVNGLQSWNTVWNNGQPVTSHLLTTFVGGGQRTVTANAPDGSRTITAYLYGRVQSVTRYDAWWGDLGQTTYAYDAHGRARFITDARNGTTTNWFNNADQISGTRTPIPAAGQSAQSTTNFFDTSGRIWKTTLPDNTSVTNEYFATGLLKKTSGSRTYPVEYTYDAQGRMATMKTWQNFTAGTGTATTTWRYDIYRGWLTNKVYADGKGTIYSNTPAGRLKSRTWARGVNTIYSYSNAGDLSGVDYSDTTPDVSYGYDRRGRQTTMAAGGVTTTKTFNDAGLLTVENYSGGPLNGLSVTNGYDQFLRRTNLSLLSPSSQLLTSTKYAYDYGSRLQTVSTEDSRLGTVDATYAYLANSPLVDNIVFATNGTTVMTTTKGYDALNRLTNITTLDAGLGTLDSHRYAYNAANQRTAITNADNARWVYTYDSLGQVTGGKKYWSDGTPVAGQHFEYAFDTIGNRQSTKAGGDNSGANLQSAAYTVNTLNQYTGRGVPGYVNSLGTANSNATVTLWSDTGLFAPTLRKGDYFRGELPVNNGTGAVWLTLTNVAVLNDGSNPDIVTNQTGNVLLPKTPQAYTYDFDGNLTSDGLWTNTWNGENRRTVISSGAGVPHAARVQVQWTHLPDGRWIERIVSTWNGSAYVPSFTNRYVWDGQMLLAVLNHTNGLELSLLRGLDLSGTMQGAGGVGGVLFIGHFASAIGHHAAAYDGNGNVTALVSAADGSESARYEYGPFGEPLRITGPMGKANPIRFSTQYADDVTGDLKYLFRDYDASGGRWPSRDPIIEQGGPNLFGFVLNDPLQYLDRNGEDIGGPGPFPIPHPPSGPSYPDPRPNPAPQPPSPPKPPSSDKTGVELCNRPIENPSNDWILGCCNLVGHDFYRWPNGKGGYGSVGLQEPKSKDGDLPEEDKPEKARACRVCHKRDSELKYGSGKGKTGREASDAEIQDCLKNRPIKGDYHGLRNNCNDWARGAKKDCGLWCENNSYLVK